MPVKRYRKLPVEIEAIQFTNGSDLENLIEVSDFAPGKFALIQDPDRSERPEITAEVYDYLHDTWVGVRDGDYIIKGLKGEYYPHDLMLFPLAYEEVAE